MQNCKRRGNPWRNYVRNSWASLASWVAFPGFQSNTPTWISSYLSGHFASVSFTNSSCCWKLVGPGFHSSSHYRYSQPWLPIIIIHRIKKKNSQTPTLTWVRLSGEEAQAFTVVKHHMWWWCQGWQSLLSILDLSILFTTGAPAVIYMLMPPKFTYLGMRFPLSSRSVFPTAFLIFFNKNLF